MSLPDDVPTAYGSGTRKLELLERIALTATADVAVCTVDVYQSSRQRQHYLPQSLPRLADS